MILLFFVLFIFEFINVKALETTDGYYTNKENVIMTKTQIENLINLGFTETEIDLMEQNEFDNNKNLKGEVVAQTQKYYKTVITYKSNNLQSRMILNKDSIENSVTTEITKEEYENSKDEPSISTLGLTNGYTETNYKQMTTTIIYVNNNYYRYKNTLVWKKLPSTRNYDIMAIGIDPTVSGVSGSEYFKRTADIDDSSSGTCYYDTSTLGTWNKGSNGYTVTFKLPSNTSSKTVTALNSYMYFNVQKLTSATILTLNAYGNYKHAQQTVSSTVGSEVSVSSNMTIEFSSSISATVVESYDSMSTAQATWSGLSW